MTTGRLVRRLHATWLHGLISAGVVCKINKAIDDSKGKS